MNNNPDETHIEIDALFDTAASEDAAVDAMENALRQFRAAQDAKAQLFNLPPEALRDSVRRRGLRVAGEGA